MRLSIDSFDNLIFLESDYVSVISIQSVHYYAKIVRSFFFECNGMDGETEIALIDDKEKRLSISSGIEFIADPLLIDFSSKRLSTALIGLLKQELNNDVEVRMDIEEALRKAQRKVVSLIDDFDLPIKYDDAWDATKMIKATAISIDDNVEGLTHLEILKRYIQVVSELKVNSYFCFAGLNNILTEEEIIEFYKESLQRQVGLICIQHDNTCPNPNKYACTTFIDDDFDEHIINPI